MPKKRMWVEWDDDAELSQSQKSPGAYSPLTRDADRKLGHVTLSDIDEYEEDLEDDDWAPDFDAHAPDEQGWRIGEILELVESLTPVFVAAKPHVERWWKDQARPALRSTNRSVRGRLARTRKIGRPTRIKAVTSVDAAPNDEHLSMTSEEARQRLLAAIAARAFSDEQVRLLARARIRDAGEPLAFESLMEQFWPQEVEGQVGLLLEANPGLVEEFYSRLRDDRIGDNASIASGGEGPKWRRSRREGKE
jgi:hypothetical protein